MREKESVSLKRMDPNQCWQEIASYCAGSITRRDLLKSLVAGTGSYTVAHLFLEASGVAQEVISPREAQAANIDAETVHYASGAIQIEGYLAKPKGAGRHPTVIVIHENRGRNEHIHDVARYFAGEGLVALAPDLLSRVGGTGKMATIEEATEAIRNLPIYDVLDDLRAGFLFLENHSAVDAQKISTVGFCWGGWRSFMLATREPKLHRAVVFYGSSPDAGYEGIHTQVLAHYAQWDTRITGNAVWTEKVMQQAGKQFRYSVYPNAQRAFFNDTGPRHDPEAAKLAWARTLEFLRS